MPNKVIPPGVINMLPWMAGESRLFHNLLAQHWWQLPDIKAVEGDCQWPLESGGNSREPIMPCSVSIIQHRWGVPNLYLDQPMSQLEAMSLIPRWQSSSYPTRIVKQSKLRLQEYLKVPLPSHRRQPWLWSSHMEGRINGMAADDLEIGAISDMW